MKEPFLIFNQQLLSSYANSSSSFDGMVYKHQKNIIKRSQGLDKNESILYKLPHDY